MKSLTRLLITASLLGIPGVSEAQVVVSGGIQEIYDDNIFLESGEGFELPDGTDPTLLTPANDGKKDDDIITNAYVSMAGAVPITERFRTSAGARVNTLFFKDRSDENRIGLDTNLNAVSERTFIPDPYQISLSSALTSGANNIAAAQGTATRQTQIHQATLGLAARGMQVDPNTTASIDYALIRHDFLGEWLLGGGSSGEGRIEEVGSDFLSNRITPSLQRIFTQQLSGSFLMPIDYTMFTNVESRALTGGDNLDRWNINPSVGADYFLSQELNMNGRVGMNITQFAEEPAARIVTVQNDDGTITSRIEQPSKNQNNLFFSGGINYAPNVDTVLSLGAMQAAGTDIDGSRILTRSATLNGSYLLTDRLTLGGAARLIQFSNDDSLSNATDRWEASASVRYALSPSMSLGLGYSYVTQSADGFNSGIAGRDGDFDSNRVFLSLDAGLVGLQG